MCFMFYACLILLYVFISGMLCNAVIRNKRIQTMNVEPALIYDNFIRITTHTGIFRTFQAKINIENDISEAEDNLVC